ncbi:MAG: ATP-binding protein [Verrucomicrobiota bacterium]
MRAKSNTWAAFGLLAGIWLLVAAWQAAEYQKVKESARTDLRKSSKAIANTVGAFLRGLQFRGAVIPERLEPTLNELVNGSTNELVKSGELVSIALLNNAGDFLASAGRPIDLDQKDIVQEGERWGRHTVTMVYPVEGATVSPEGTPNATTVVLPPFRDFTNNSPEAFRRGFPRRDGRDPGPPPPPGAEPAPPGTNGSTNAMEPPPRPREPDSRPHRPFWARGLDEDAYQALIKKRELHGLAIVMSTDTLEAACEHDIWQRTVILFFAAIAAVGAGLAWRTLAKSADLQIRLVRASELNTHLKEMNLAAAGLAHETRNPLNIIRGRAQMISRLPDAPDEIRTRSREIIEETDKVTAQLNEFINYSRPREIRPTAVALHSLVGEVIRALKYDIEENKIQVEMSGEPVLVEADDQMLRQVLFNLVINAIQATGPGGSIQVVSNRHGTSEAVIEVRDDGPGVPPERRQEIFKPYFTTQQKGTGLGLAIVHQIIQAHGWEIECRAHTPKGAVFRITHLKIAGRR